MRHEGSQLGDIERRYQHTGHGLDETRLCRKYASRAHNVSLKAFMGFRDLNQAMLGLALVLSVLCPAA